MKVKVIILHSSEGRDRSMEEKMVDEGRRGLLILLFPLFKCREWKSEDTSGVIVAPTRAKPEA